MLINLLSLSDETKFYLTHLISQSVATKEDIFLSNSSYTVNTRKYIIPTPPSVETTATESGASPNEAGLFAQISSYINQTLTYYFPTFFSRPMVRPPLLTREASHNPASSIRMDFELSHHLLIKKEQESYIIYLVEKTPFSEGSFGAVYDVPGQLILNSTTNEFTFNPCQNVVKHILNHSVFEEESVRNEFKHLKQIYPSSELFSLSRFPVSNHHNNVLFNREFFGNDYWIVTKKIDGLQLNKININQLTTPQKLNIALSLLWELYQLHHSELLGGVHIHNDIKPSNIIVDENGIGHFCDYGSATLENEPVNTLTIKYSNLPGFSWPAKFSSDIYSLGIVLFQLFLSANQIPDDVERWNLLPKGKNKKMHKTWKADPKKTGLTGAKILESEAQKNFYHFFHHKTAALVSDIAGLDKAQQTQLFSILKEMRTEPPASIEQTYHAMLTLAANVEGFDMSYFKDKQIHAAAVSLSL